MDYTAQPFTFKTKKVLRYLRLYGPARTLAKVRGQYHMNKRYERLPQTSSDNGNDSHIGIIGCGNFAYSNIAYFLKKNYGRVIRGAMDIDINRAASLFESYGLSYYTDDAERIIKDPRIQLVYIASNHASHAEYAIAALERGKCVHIEKPHVVSDEQLVRLCEAMRKSGGKAALGFNRPGSRAGRIIKSELARQKGAAMLNWFIAGHEIAPNHWYFQESEGGRVLGNLCHWTDFIFQMVSPGDCFPVRINPSRARKSDCDIAVNYIFADGSIGAITFSAKGHTFEGVRERFAAHRGNALISMDDFQTLTVEVADRKYRYRSIFRDHGHKASICNSYNMARSKDTPGCSTQYVWETGLLFLRTKEALERNGQVTLNPKRV
jgi:predicted dehydrogenase